MKKELIAILQLLKTGNTEQEYFTPSEIIKFLLKLILISIITTFLVFVIIQLINHYLITIPRPDRFDKIKRWSTLKIIFFSTFLAPISEELTFRLPLRFSKTNISILVAFIAYVTSRLLFDIEYERLISYSFGCIIGLVFYKYFTNNSFKRIQLFWQKHRLFIFYFFLLSFSFLHLGNHSEITKNLLLLSPIVILPKITISILLSYARLKAGIGSSIALHMINNGIVTILFLLNR